MIRHLFLLLVFALPFPVIAQNDGIEDEKAIKVFSYLLNGEAGARIHLDDMRRVAAGTPYSALVVLGVSRQLLVWGWERSEARKLIEACANAASGVGANDDGFVKIVLLVGRLTDEEESTYVTLSGLEDVGIPVWQISGYLIGRSATETKSLSLQGRLKPRGMAQALIAGFNNMYPGAAGREAEKMKATLRQVFAQSFQESIRSEGCGECAAYVVGDIFVVTEPRVEPKDSAEILLSNKKVVAELRKFGFRSIRTQQRISPSAISVDRPLPENSTPVAPPVPAPKKTCARNGVIVPCP